MHLRLSITGGRKGLALLEGAGLLQQHLLRMQGYLSTPPWLRGDALHAEGTAVTDGGVQAEVLTGRAVVIVPSAPQVGRHLAGGTGTGELFQVNREIFLGEAVLVRPFWHLGDQRPFALHKGLARAASTATAVISGLSGSTASEALRPSNR